MKKRPAEKPNKEYTPEEQYARTGQREKRSKVPDSYKEATLSGRMAAYAIQQIPKEYKLNPWDGNDLSEDNLAEDIVKHCGRYIRYTENGWMGWSSEDGCWKGEEYAESMVQWIVRHYGRLLAEHATEEYHEGVRYARHILSSAGINAMMAILKRDKRIAMPFDKFDTALELLNCQGDLYNLKTGEVRPVEPEDYITKTMLCKPADVDKRNEGKPSALPPQFADFMRKITSKYNEENKSYD